MSRGRVLFVAQSSPPAILSAARRTAGLTKYLDRLGYEVTVLTSQSSGRGAGVPGAARTIRTPDLMASGLNWRRGSFEAISSGEGGGSDYEARPSRLAEWVVPDVLLASWLPFALPRALGLARRGEVECVITTGPPHSVHLVGLALAHRGVPWVADFRDGWSFESNRRPFALAALRAADRELERRVVTGATRVQAVTEPIARDLAQRFAVEAVVLTNGFDPEEAAGANAAAAHRLLDDRKRSLVHTGTLSFGDRSPAPLLAALRRLREQRPELASSIEVVFAGPTTRSEHEAIAGLDGLARDIGTLPREEALALQSAADALLIITSGRSGTATGKLFEYLRAGVPILVLGETTAAARIVEKAGLGLATSADEPGAIAAAIERILDWEVGPGAGDVGEFSYPELARRLADQIEAARSSARTARQ